MKKVKLNLVKYLLILGVIMPMTSCKEDDPEEPPKRTEKEITAFGIPALELTGVINPAAYTITLTVTPDYDQSRLENVAPHIEYKGVNIEPAATTPQNFSQNVTYKVTAEDGTYQNYTVSLAVSEFFATGFAKTTEVWTKDWTTLGYAAGIQNTLAYLNGKLVASRSDKILDAATGEATGGTLNLTGATGKFHPTIATNDYPFALTNDDAGNVIGVALGAWTTSFLPVYKWTSSLESAPTQVYELNSSTWTGGNLNRFGRKISVTGNINGNGYIAQYHQSQGGSAGDEKQYVWKITGGAVEPNYTAIEARTGDKSYYQTLIPMTTTSIYPYYLAVNGHSSGDPHSEISYKANESAEKEIINGFLDNHFSSNWGSYVRHAKKFEFNGVTYLAILSVDSEENYYLSILDTRNNEIKRSIQIPKVVTNGNGSSAVTNSLEETLGTGEKTIRLYTLITDWGVYCHELSNKP